MKYYTAKQGEPFLHLIGKPVVGMKYHITWGLTKGVVGKCYQINDDDTVLLRTPKTAKPFKYPVKYSELLHTRAQQYRIEANLDPYEGNKILSHT